MSIPNHSILPSTEADVATLASFVQESKLQLAINRFLIIDWPNEPVQQALYTSAVESALKDPQVDTMKVVDDRSGDIVASMVLSRRSGDQAKVSTADAEGSPAVPHGVNPDVFSVVMDSVKEINEGLEGIEHLGMTCNFTRPAASDQGTNQRLELTHICVAPSSRRQGIGSQLMRLAVDKATAARLPLITCSEPPAHEFFLKQGLIDTKWVDIDLRKWAPDHAGYGVFRISGMSLPR
ncbi:hypothetical protein FH972_024121 [Carpinus fangiana]|uniref:N-acetyltransferase domain-containing protein n=1 Tax=Carpinus fangiana TaxID=176857 RepID=A0A5N6KXL0_9ROSI|nr:hypothetical protein FH972_024121 [Carpinus fangiana]